MGGVLAIAWLLPSVARANYGPGILIQGPPQPGGEQLTAQQHYDEAFRLQEAGEIQKADREHKLFLAMALHDIANGRANIGEYGRAVPLYEEALGVTPDDYALCIDYAGAALDAFDWNKAKAMATTAIDARKRSGQPPSSAALSILAQALMGRGQYREALEQFKAIAELEPGYKSDFALAGAYLALGDKANAGKIFDQMPAKFGDTARLHMDIGRLYGQALYYDEAIQEFRAAIDKDDGTLAGLHYSLGATLMMRFGEPSFSAAEVELRKELAIKPDEALAYTALGRIETMQHRYAEGEADLQRAVEFDPQSTAAYAQLGELLTDEGKDAEAEAAFRKQIALTLVPAKNDYEVQRAHFQLGRLLEKNGDAAGGRRELEISRDLLYEKSQQVESKLRGNAGLFAPVEKTRLANPEDRDELNGFEERAGRILASSYDSLGVHAAVAGDFAAAAGYFARAAQWDPGMNGLDRKWARASVAAKDYAQALGPLSRILATQPNDPDIRSSLGLSYFMTHDYARAVEVLRPMEATLDSNSPIGLAYFGSMAVASSGEEGLARLKTLEQAHPDAEIVHRLLGEAYATRKQYALADKEYRAALGVAPGSSDAKFGLAIVYIEEGKKADAHALLSELAKSGSKNGEVYFRLGRVQSELGIVGQAVRNLKTAVALSPANPAYHRELAKALKLNEQTQDAERESRRAEDLQAKDEAEQRKDDRAVKISDDPGESRDYPSTHSNHKN
jgi:tetratricopeptide (TPR) repeat protein